MNEAKLYEVVRAPRVSEKTARLQELSNQYAFEVSRDATKADIKAAVEKLFDVKVEAVNVLNVKGKNKSFRFRAGRRGAPRVQCVAFNLQQGDESRFGHPRTHASSQRNV